MEKVNIFCHSFEKVKPIYCIDWLHIEWNISSFYFLKSLWLWVTDNENPKFSVQISKLNAKFNFIWKEDFGPLSNSPVLLLFSPGKMLLMMFLVQKWLGSSFPEDVWAWWLLTPDSVHSLWSSSKCLNRLCLTVFSSLCSSLLLVHIFIPNFFLPVNFAFNMLWYSTPWTATPFSNVFWTIAKSAVFFIIELSKNKRYPECILYGWSFIETQM